MTHRHRPCGRLRAAIRLNQSRARIKAVPLLTYKKRNGKKKNSSGSYLCFCLVLWARTWTSNEKLWTTPVESSRTCIVQILTWLQVQLKSEVGPKQTTGPDGILAGLVIDWGVGGSHQCFCMARKFQPISRGSLSCQSQSAFRKQNQAIATRIRPGGMHSWSRWGLMTSKESPHRPLCCYLTEDAETPAVIPPTEPAEPHSRPILPQVMTLMYSSTFPNCGSSSLAVLTFTCSWGDVILLSAG